MMRTCKNLFVLVIFLTVVLTVFGSLQASAGSISGTVSYSGSSTGTVYVGLFDSPNITPGVPSPLYVTTMSGPGAYTITNVPDGTYYVGAIRTNDVNHIQMTDPYGMYGIDFVSDFIADPVVVSGGAAVTGKNFMMIDGTQQYPNPFYVAPGNGTGTHTASGTYTYNSGTGALVWNWTSSDFICEGPSIGQGTDTVTSLTSTTLIWESNGNAMTWTRPGGTAGDILGTWTSTDSTTGNSWTITFNADGTVSLVANIVSCSAGATISLSSSVKDNNGLLISGATIEQVGNSSVTTTSASDGSFTLNGLPSGTDFSIKMTAAGYVPIYSKNFNSTSNITPQPYTFHTSISQWGVNAGKGVIDNRVVDTANVSTGYIENAVVSCTSAFYPGACPYTIKYRDDQNNWGATATYSNGKYYILNVDDGDTVAVTAAKTGWNFGQTTFVTHADAESQGRIHGTVLDADGDGYTSDVDCDDTNPNIHPGATEIPNNGIDDNCDGQIDESFSLLVTPSSAPADTTTGFTFYTQAATAGGVVLFEMFGDFNNNGVVDGDDWLLFSELIVDNATTGDVDPLTLDTDPSSKNITTVFNLYNFSGGNPAYLPDGNAIMRVQNSLGESATVQFSVTPVSAPLIVVSGTVYIQGTTTPVPYAFVECEDSTTENYISSTFADSNGSYTLQIPTSGDISIGTFKEGYIELPYSNINVPPSGISNYNLYLISADAQISGTVMEYGTGNPVWGAEVWAETLDGKGSYVITDINGNFTLPVLSGMEWEVGAERIGYISSSTIVITPPANNINLVLLKSDAQITGTVTEYETGNPLGGDWVWANTIEGLESSTSVGSDGNFALPVLSGREWRVGAGAPPGYFAMRAPAYNYEQQPIITPTVSGPNIVNFEAHKETAWIDGTVKDERGEYGVEGALFYAQRTNTNDPALQTLGNGHYSNASGQVTVGIEAGDWRAGLCINCHGHPIKVGGVEKEMVSPGETAVTGLATGEHRQVEIRLYYADGAIEGDVFRENGSEPAPEDVGIVAWTNNALNGTGQTSIGFINAQARTDGNGHFRLPLLGGTWSVWAEMFNWNRRSETQVITITTNGDEIVGNQAGEVITGINLVLNLEFFDIEVTPVTINFGNINVGSSSDDTVTVKNNGTENLTIGSITPPSSPFSIVGDNCSGQTLAPSATCTITVRFTPTTNISSIDSFNIFSNDPDENPVIVNLSGTGTVVLPCADNDNDGYGNPGDPACRNGSQTDCNDNNSSINPGASDSNCNGIDENCSGTADEGYVSTPTNCGQGVCASTGQNICQGGQIVNTCQQGNPTGNDSNCNGIDENCNGTADENYASTTTYCGIGACASTGVVVCVGGSMPHEYDTCTPGTPTAEICDGVDNNCNGQIDEGFDADVDGISDCYDNCPSTYNPNQADSETPADIISYWKFDEGSGSIANDSTGSSDGIIYGATWTAGKAGSALSFDSSWSSSSYVSVPDTNFPPGNSARTIETWVKTSTVSRPQVMFYYGSGADGDDVNVMMHDSGVLTIGNYGGGPNEKHGTTVVNDGQWHHVVFVYDGVNNVKLYVDGALDTLDNDTRTYNTNLSGSATISAPWPGWGWNGLIDELAIYGRAITASEIQRHYQQGLSGNGYSGDGVGDACESEHTASGTYTYNSGTGVITWNWTSSDFTCDGPEIGQGTDTVTSLTATTMIWSGDNMTWTRPSGTAGDIVGTWTFTNSTTGNSYTLTFNADGTVSLVGIIVQCGGGGGGGEGAEAHSAWFGTNRQMTSSGITDAIIFHNHTWAPQGTVSQISVSGPSFSGIFTPCSTNIRNGIIVDEFCPTGVTDFLGDTVITVTPTVGDTYTFTVTKADSTTVTYTQTLSEVILQPLNITSPTGHALTDANLGGALNLQWTAPSAVVAGDIMIQGQVCNGTTSQFVEGTVSSAAAGAISLPNLSGATGAYVDVRVHHGNQVFMHTMYEFGSSCSGGMSQYPIAYSYHWSDGYRVTLQYNDLYHAATSVSVTGPGITGSLPLVYNDQGGVGSGYGSWNSSSNNVFFGTTSPTGLPFTYTFYITDATGTWTTTSTVSCFQEEFATNLSPTGTVTGTPTFSWTRISNASATYGVYLQDSNNNRIWGDIVNISGTSIVYSGPALTPGMTYVYGVTVESNSNACISGSSLAQGSFVYQNGGGLDNDGDGYTSDVDCDDTNPNIHPGASEICDGIDNDCNGQIDEGYISVACDGPDSDLCNDDTTFCIGGSVNCSTGDDDTEICANGIDDDCNGSVDEGCPTGRIVSIPDTSGMGSVTIPINVNDATGVAGFQFTITYTPTVVNCTGATAGDLNSNWVVTPNTSVSGQIGIGGFDPTLTGLSGGSGSIAKIQCSVIGSAGQSTPLHFDLAKTNKLTTSTGTIIPVNFVDGNFTTCTDNDHDGYYVDGGACGVIDCNDYNASINQGASDSNCNGIDENCDGTPDDGYVPTIVYCSVGQCIAIGALTCLDGQIVDTCQPPQPSTEICDGKDNDCDGQIDEGVKNTYYQDADSDGYGNPNVTTQACTAPQGYAANNTDCNDGNPAVNPGASEIYNNGIDNDCNPNTFDRYMGDINIDEGVDIVDVILDLRCALELDPMAQCLQECGDINGDDVIDIVDVILTLRMALQLDPLRECL